MALTFDIKEDYYYIRGINEGKIENREKMIIALLKKGKLSFEEIADAAEVPLDYVKNLAKGLEKK